jgi:hypothetical protein
LITVPLLQFRDVSFPMGSAICLFLSMLEIYKTIDTETKSQIIVWRLCIPSRRVIGRMEIVSFLCSPKGRLIATP